MDYHAYIDAWGGGWLNFVVIFAMLALIYYIVELCFYDNNNNSEISVFSEEDTHICDIYWFDNECVGSYYFIDNDE